MEKNDISTSSEESLFAAHSGEEDPIQRFLLTCVFLGLLGLALVGLWPEVWFLTVPFVIIMFAFNILDATLILRRVKSIVLLKQDVLVMYWRKTFRIPYTDLLLVGWALEDSSNKRRHFLHKALEGKTEIIQLLRERGCVREI